MCPSAELLSASDKEFDAMIRDVLKLKEENFPVEEGAWQWLSAELDVYCELLKACCLNSN